MITKPLEISDQFIYIGINRSLTMKNILRLLMVILAGWVVLHSHALADDQKARDIMQKVEDRDEGDNRTAEMEMFLIDKKGY